MPFSKIFTVILMFILSFSASAQAQDERRGTLEENFKAAELITLGRVTDYRELTGQVMGVDAVCGYVVDIEVLHAFRGRRSNYQLFIEGERDKPLIGERYFLTAGLNPIYNRRGTDRYTYCQLNTPNENGELAAENGAVDLSNFRYSTRGIAGSMHLVDPYLERKLGGDWLIIDDIPGARDAAAYVEQNENPLHPQAYVGTDFVGFLQDYWILIDPDR